MSGFAMKAYKQVAVETGVGASDPHQLILMLYDGALEAVRQGIGHLEAGRIAEKGRALGKAARIVEEGLKASLDSGTGGSFAVALERPAGSTATRIASRKAAGMANCRRPVSMRAWLEPVGWISET